MVTSNPGAIPAKFGWGRLRVKHSDILIIIYTLQKHKYQHMHFFFFFCVNLSLFCKVEKDSLIFLWNWMPYIGSLSTKSLKNLKKKSSKAFSERMLCASYTSASIFLSRYYWLLLTLSVIYSHMSCFLSIDLRYPQIKTRRHYCNCCLVCTWLAKCWDLYLFPQFSCH